MRSYVACLSLAALSLLAACGSKAVPGPCGSCAAGTHCDDPSGNCLPDATDDAGSEEDMAQAGGCAPKCSGLAPHCNATGHCVACLDDTHCPLGSYCKISGDAIATCTPGCADAKRCAMGSQCCNKSCAAVATDPQNCGACGTVCKGVHAQVACVAGKCTLSGTCDSGWGDCNKDPKDGCETNLHVDPDNCKTCGAKCAVPNAVNACADGCYAAACLFGFDDCNNDPMDGCETSVLMDGLNCGACGKPCTKLPHAMAGCSNGQCSLGKCDPGFFDCDGDPKTGCESDLMNDAKNCTKCGTVCPMNAPYCAGGVCQNGCVNGHPVPLACTGGKDPGTMDPWVVCQADCNIAWIAHAVMAGGKFHALAICMGLGYTKLGLYGGTCGNTCGYCIGGTSCMAPQMATKFDNGGMCGNDGMGVILCQTVHWQCLK
ncbi:MAG: hypothetical protein EXR72_18095 [Myxococcales bacterium]|nr:hypothetical protein [Myxococcales bacterium]